MTEDEKKLIQARHRLEAVQARNRQKERKARTRRLYPRGTRYWKVVSAGDTTTFRWLDLPRKLHDKLSNAPVRGSYSLTEVRTYSPPASRRWYVRPLRREDFLSRR